jgi:amino acid adenylation domain-containing protein
MKSSRDKQRRQALTRRKAFAAPGKEAEPTPNNSSRTSTVRRSVDLPTTRPRQEPQRYCQARQTSVLAAEVIVTVDRLSAQTEVEPWVPFLAVFKAVLARYSRQEEIAVAMPCCLARNRTRGQLEGLAVLDLSTDLSRNPTFRELLARVQRAAAAAREESENSHKARDDEGAEESLSRQVIFVMNGGPEASDLSPAPQPELALSLSHASEGVEALITYNAELFDAGMIARLLLHYQELLKSAAANPDQRLGTLPLVTAAERRQLLTDWNSTKREYPQDQCLHQLIEAQARRTPDAIAVAFADRQLSYHELNGRANWIARRLQKLGVGPDVLVGLCVERSPEMFIGMLAILKAGGAYVPLEPTEPDERLGIILSEVQPRVVLTHGRLSRRFSERYPVLSLDEQLSSITDEDASDLRVEMTPDNLAYVIFTSGSTGMPKGVLVAHRSLINHGTAMAHYFDLRSYDRVLQFALCSFDVAAEEIFPTWLSGATVVSWPATPGFTAVSALINFVENQKITVLNLPAPFWEEWVSDLVRLSVPSCVRLLVVGSDKVSSEKFLSCRKQIGEHVRLCNAYGLTEATITATIYEPDGDYHHSTADCVPIGRPIANTQVYVLDQNLHLVPIGVAGELYIGGDCLARGYLKRPELTAERFLENPYGGVSGARIYKTGDLARYLPDGNLEYLGRIDDQVKLRGFRIELGEIESVLRQIAGVQRAAVLLREDRPGDKRLVAYVVCRPADCTAENLRLSLREKLPDYMVPSAFVFLETFPLLPSGKIDRRALPRPTADRSESDDSFVACRTFTERQLADIWEEILAVKPIGIRDNFFDLGGDSLRGVRLMLQVEKTFGKSFTLAALYEAPCVELMSKLITEGSETRRWSSLVPLQPNGPKPPFFWIHGETSDGFLPRYLGPDQPVYGLRHQGDDGRPACYTTVKEIAAHYLHEIRSVRPQGPYFLGGYCFGGLVAFEIAQTLRKEGQAVPLLVLLAPDRPVNVLGELSPAKPADNELERSMQPEVSRSRAAELQRQLDTVTKLSARQIARRLYLSVRARISGYVASPAIKIGKKIACRICFGLRARLPIALRSFYIIDVYGRAVKEYVAESYNGSVVLFKPFDDAIDVASWQRLIGDGLEIHHVAGNHTDVLIQPEHVKMWAETLMRYLRSAGLQ